MTPDDDRGGKGADMSDVNMEARPVVRPRGGTARRQGAKPSGGAKRPGAQTLRVQLHLGGQTVERLRVHTALCHRSDSAMADEILLGWLSRYGRGRDLFPS